MGLTRARWVHRLLQKKTPQKTRQWCLAYLRLLLTKTEHVEEETVDNEEIQPRKSREEKVLEVLESGEFIHKISPQVRRKFVAPAGWKM